MFSQLQSEASNRIKMMHGVDPDLFTQIMETANVF